MTTQTPNKTVTADGTATVMNNNTIDNLITGKLAELTEDIAALYGVKIEIDDTDWQVIFDLKAELYESMANLGVIIDQGN